jgi:hypothetical protein
MWHPKPNLESQRGTRQRRFAPCRDVFLLRHEPSSPVNGVLIAESLGENWSRPYSRWHAGITHAGALTANTCIKPPARARSPAGEAVEGNRIWCYTTLVHSVFRLKLHRCNIVASIENIFLTIFFAGTVTVF